MHYINIYQVNNYKLLYIIIYYYTNLFGWKHPIKVSIDFTGPFNVKLFDSQNDREMSEKKRRETEWKHE